MVVVVLRSTIRVMGALIVEHVMRGVKLVSGVDDHVGLLRIGVMLPLTRPLKHNANSEYMSFCNTAGASCTLQHHDYLW